MNPTGPASAGIGTASPWRLRSPSSISAPTGYSYEIFIDRASRPSGGPATASSSASSAESPTVAMIGFSPAAPGSRTRAASTPRIAPAASSTRVSTSSRSIVPPSSPRILPRRSSSVVRSAVERSSSSMPSIRLVSSSITFSKRRSAARRSRRRTTRKTTASTARMPPKMAQPRASLTGARPMSSVSLSPSSFRPPRRLSTRPRLTVDPHRRSRYGSKRRNPSFG